MKLNFQRGFFRIWIAVAVLWVVPALIINSKDLGLTAQRESGPTVNDAGVSEVRPSVKLSMSQYEVVKDGKTYSFEAPNDEEAAMAVTEFHSPRGAQGGPQEENSGGSEPIFVSTTGVQFWAASKFEITDPAGKSYVVEAGSMEQADAAVLEMKGSGAQGAPYSERDDKASKPIFVSPTNGARVWPGSMTLDDLPGRKAYAPPALQLSPSEQQAALRSARNEALAIVFIPPLALLVLGVSFGWIVRGFSPKPSAPV